MRRPAGARFEPLTWVPLAVAVAAAAYNVRLLVWQADRQLDLTDESSYLLAADPGRPGGAFNGLFGRYTGLLYAAVGYDITAFRVAGALLLTAAGAFLGWSLARAVGPAGRPARALLAATCAALSLTFYTLFIRVPGYNWLTLVGTLLAAGGFLRLLDLGGGARLATRVAAAVPLAVGTFLATWGKAPAGPALAVLAVLGVGLSDPAGRRQRWGTLLLSAAVGALLLGAHFAIVLGPAATVDTLRRSAAMLAVVDPAHYGLSAAVGDTASALGALPGEVWRAAGPLPLGPLLGLLARAVPPSRRGPVFAAAALAGVAGTGAVAVFGAWQGGSIGFQTGVAPVVAVLLAVSVAALAARAVFGPVRPAGRRRVLAPVLLVLLGSAVGYAFGSNNALTSQLATAAVLVAAPALAVATVALPGRTATAVLAVLAVLLSVGSVLVVRSARIHPYRVSPLYLAQVPVEFGPHRSRLVVDPTTARYLSAVRSAAVRAGFRPGTPLLDLTFTPAVPYDLQAQVPNTLLPAFPRLGSATASARFALRHEGLRHWQAAWILLPENAPSLRPNAVVAVLGRQFPESYQLVGRFQSPADGGIQTLWRPRG